MNNLVSEKTDGDAFWGEMVESMRMPADVPSSADILSGNAPVLPDCYSREYTPMVEVIVVMCIEDLGKLWAERKRDDGLAFTLAGTNFMAFVLTNFSQKIYDIVNRLAKASQIPLQIIIP